MSSQSILPSGVYIHGLFTLTGGVCQSSPVVGQPSKQEFQLLFFLYSNWSQKSVPILPDDTIAFISGKLAVFRAGQPAQIDAIAVVAVPGDPSLPSYETQVPLFYPIVCGVGYVVDHSFPTSQYYSMFLLTCCQ
ncbi:hypothetical protein BDP27DRAFT_1430084 [Rhodocollybia butyracea]|uniref:Uncharacterized protein n=1 Tax=Rhodocollybia butyracea TaxID=206335 RepID=A0A9P5P7S4_9AGAR|nr:hypothetical protein BDP27DRAFT_1430084 [Rhodocollybia butyracea]